MAICDHKSVGMLIWNGDRLLLIERRKPPYGFAPPAGHIDDHGSFEKAAKAEVKEEVGLKVTDVELTTEGRKENACRRENGAWHYWKIFNVKVEGQIMPSSNEVKQCRWFTKEQLRELSEKTKEYLSGKLSEDTWQESPGLEPVWRGWLSELNVIM